MRTVRLASIIMILAIAATIAGSLAASAFAGEVHEAVRRGDQQAVRQMISADRSLLAAKDSDGSPPLNVAAQAGNLEMTKLLIDLGADVKLGDNENSNALHVAAIGGNTAVIDLLVAKGIDVNEDPLMNAAGMGRRDVVRILLDKGADPKYCINGFFTALVASFWHPDVEVVRMLLAAGADATLVTPEAGCVLHRAAMGHNLPVEIARMLVDAGADVNVKNGEGVTPLLVACDKGSTDIAKFFVSKGADASAAGGAFQATGLHAAAANGYGDLAEFLIASGAQVNAKDGSGHTPLYYAQRCGNTAVAKAIAAKGGKGGCKETTAKDLIGKRVPEGQALVVHTGHSGGVIETANNVLIFDYYQDGRRSDSPTLLNGCIDPAELAGKKVTAFVSHTVHPDHYNGMEITAALSTDAGVAFLVTVDGLTILHSGDLHNRDANVDGVYAGEIEFLAGPGRKIDMSFMPVSGCGFGDREIMKKGVWWGIDKLDPASVFWMHGGNACSRYPEFAGEAAQAGVTVPQGVPRVRGDRFMYKDGELKEI